MRLVLLWRLGMGPRRVLGSSMNFPKGHKWACWKKMEFGLMTTDVSWNNTWAKQGCNCQIIITIAGIGGSQLNLFGNTQTIQCLRCLLLVFIVCLLFVQCLFESVLLFNYLVYFLFWYSNCIPGILIPLLTYNILPAVNKHYTPDSAIFVLE